MEKLVEEDRIKLLTQEKHEFPERFVTFPDKPALKWILEPQLVQRLVLKAIELQYG